jgi:hypothetical protein
MISITLQSFIFGILRKTEILFYCNHSGGFSNNGAGVGDGVFYHNVAATLLGLHRYFP